MGAYKKDFPAGSMAKILEGSKLAEFAKSWKYHHPLQPEQMNFAGRVVEVQGVAFYHGGDPLYTLQGVPGKWHEQCLVACKDL
jgi:hypothetical protein